MTESSDGPWCVFGCLCPLPLGGNTPVSVSVAPALPVSLPWKSSHHRGLLDCTYLGKSDPVISGGLFSFACHQAGPCLGSVWGEQGGVRGGPGPGPGPAAEHSCHSFLVTSVRFGSGAWQSMSVFKSCNLVLGAGPPVQESLVFQMETVLGLCQQQEASFTRGRRGGGNHSDIVHCAWVAELGAAYCSPGTWCARRPVQTSPLNLAAACCAPQRGGSGTSRRTEHLEKPVEAKK